jgi:nucleoside 2-deoxyribosyltransferase
MIFRKDLAMMGACDVVIANLTPFRGPSADAGTLVEVGWFLGRGRPVFGYSNAALPLPSAAACRWRPSPTPCPGCPWRASGCPTT